MKKIIIGILTGMLMCVSSVYAFENPAVKDEAGFLSESEVSELETKLEAIRTEYDIDIAIYTETDMSGADAQQTADDIYDYNGYGAGENDDGMLLYVSQNPRNYHLTTYNRGHDIFGSSELSKIEDDILPHLKENDYYGAFLAYADCSESILESAAYDENYEFTLSDNLYFYGFVAVIALALSLVIALIAMLIKLSKMKTAVKKVDAEGYMKNGSVNISVSQDIFLYSTVTKVARPKESEQDTTHVSSSGRTHGGSGGSY